MNKECREENTTKWNEAIRDAEKQIVRLQAAIRSFEAHRNASIPWPGVQSVRHTA